MTIHFILTLNINDKDMADLKWSDFNKELVKHLDMVKNSFLDQTLSFDEGLIQDKDDDGETEDKKIAMEKELEEILTKGENGKEDLLGKVNTILDKKNARIKALKEALKTHKTEISNYEENKRKCNETCQVIGRYLDDKDGFIHFLSEAFQNQHRELDELKGVKEVVEKKKSDFDCLFCCKTIGLAFLVILSICAQVFLFSKLKVCTSGDTSTDCNVLTNCILVAAMVVLLVCEVFSVLGIIRLSKKKSFILQRLELILNKIEMHKVSKFEIDRDLEKVLEDMK